MKANEVRVWNWYKDRDSENYWKITGQDIFSLHEGMDSECYQPIPLTPEILEKAGFIKKGIRYSKDWVYLWQDGDNIVFALAEMQEAIGSFLPIQFVHQLQNLYFALTGEELNIEL